MARYKRLIALLIVLAAACIATFAVLRYQERQEEIKNSGDAILEVDVETVTALSWEYEGETLSFQKDETWGYDGDAAFPVDDTILDGYLSRFAPLRAAFVIEDVEDFGQYGLDAPVCTISFSAGDTSYEVLLGDYSKMDSQRYVSIGDGNVYLVEDDPLDDFDAQLSDVILHDKTPSYDRVTALRFSGTEDYEITYQEDSAATYCAGDVYFTESGGKTLPLDTSLVDSYLTGIKYLSLTDYVTYNATERELSDCGLDNPELTVTLDYTCEDEDGEDVSDTFVLHISRDPEERAAAQETEEDGDEEITAYARVGDSPILYQIASSSYTGLMAAGYDDLRHKEVLTASFDDVTAVDVALDGEKYTLTSEGDGEDRTWSCGGEELDITDFQTALETLTADRFTHEAPSGKEEIALTVYLDNENFPQVAIRLTRYDGSFCLAEIDGESVSLVPRSLAVDLVEAVNAIVLGQA